VRVTNYRIVSWKNYNDEHVIDNRIMVCVVEIWWFLWQDLDRTVSVLLSKIGDSNKFIKADAEKALVAMVENTSAQRALSAVIAHGTQSVTLRFFTVFAADKNCKC